MGEGKRRKLMPVDGIDGKDFLGVYRFPLSTNQKGDGVDRQRTRPSVEDEVESSRKNRQFQEIRKMVDSVPDVRLEKVNQLAKAIDDGTYNVSGKKIADALIQKHLVDLKA
jgi:negative regulator of flagellin synthesis FlgM